MNEATPAHGLWSLVVVNSLAFIMFAFSFARPRSRRDWRSFGAFSAFLVALFTEMYGFPLTIYLLSGRLGSLFPEVDFLTHDSGHLLEVMFGWRANPHLGPFHIVSNVLILAGFVVIAKAWGALYPAQREGRLAVAGPYGHVRHPQYVGFIMIMTGFLLQWPTLVTLLMFPVLLYMYVRLARDEEREMHARFGADYADYAAKTPRFLPRPAAARASQDGLMPGRSPARQSAIPARRPAPLHYGKEEMMTRTTATTALLLVLGLATPAAGSASSHGEPMRDRTPQQTQQALSVESLAHKLEALQERVAALEALKPPFTDLMPDYAERFHVMHRAGDAEDWAVALHELEAMKRLTRISKHVDPKLGSMLSAFMDGNLRRLEEAIEHGNGKAFRAALEDTVKSCNGCHQANGSPVVVSLKVEDTMSMRHPHDLRESTAPKDHAH